MRVLFSKTPSSVWLIALLLLISLACGNSTETTNQADNAAANSIVADESGSSSPDSDSGNEPEQATEPENTPAPTSTPAPTNTPEPTATPTPLPIGLSRSNPYPISEKVSAPNWDIQVMEVIRGADAWAMIQATNQFNDPAPEGMEYVLVKIHATSTYADSEEHSIGRSDFNLTGDNLINYSPASVVVPDPELDGRVFTGGEVEGWTPFLVVEGEGNLILVVDELLSFDDDRLRFIALDEGASIAVSPDLAEIQPTEAGTERNNPAPVSETVITEDWEVTVLELFRGEEAWAMVLEANQFNEPPAEGMEYIVARVRIRYIGAEDKAELVDGSFFKSTGSASVLYDVPPAVDPDPQLDAYLYPGGEFEGWVTVQVAVGETGVMLVFEPWFNFSGNNKRFIAIE
jgi:hypothetical protein